MHGGGCGFARGWPQLAPRCTRSWAARTGMHHDTHTACTRAPRAHVTTRQDARGSHQRAPGRPKPTARHTTVHAARARAHGNTQSSHQDARGCTWLTRGCTRMHKDAPGCTRLTRGCTRTPRTSTATHPAHTMTHEGTQSLHEDAPGPTVGHTGAHVPCTRACGDARVLHEDQLGCTPLAQGPMRAPGYTTAHGALARRHTQLAHTPPTPSSLHTH